MRLLPASAFADVFGPLRGRRVGYVRLPGNVGDALIERAAFQLLRAFRADARVLDPDAGPADAELVVVAGGGSMGTLYPACRQLRERALGWGRPVTVLPQSFTGPEPLPYARVFVRERESLRLRTDAALAPDLALGLDVGVEGKPDRDVGVWLRVDAEGLFRDAASDGDPVRACRAPEEYLRLAARHRHVVTDRLHFAIAALVCGRAATLLPNAYHKNRSMYDTWLRDLGCGWLDAPPTRPAPRAVAAHGPVPRQEPVTFVIVCMGRLDHLRRSLPAAAAQPGCKVLVVDYSCPDRCGDWVERRHPGVAVVRVPGQAEFHLARGRNLGATAAGTPWLCFLDADVVVAPGFAAAVVPALAAGGYYRPHPASNGTAGTVLAARADFDRVGGYDEAYRGYGGEDKDLYAALEAAGVVARSFPGALVSHIPHPDARRTEHYAVKDLWATVDAGRVYQRIKFDLARRGGAALRPDDRRRLYDLVRDRVLAWRAGGAAGPLTIALGVEGNNSRGAATLTYRFAASDLTADS